MLSSARATSARDSMRLQDLYNLFPTHRDQDELLAMLYVLLAARDARSTRDESNVSDVCAQIYNMHARAHTHKNKASPILMPAHVVN